MLEGSTTSDDRSVKLPFMAALSPSVPVPQVPSVPAPIASAFAAPPRPSSRVASGGLWAPPDPSTRAVDRWAAPATPPIAAVTSVAWPAPDPAMRVSTVPPAPTRYALPARVLIEPALQVDHETVMAGTGLDPSPRPMAPPSDSAVAAIDPFALPPDPATRRSADRVFYVPWDDEPRHTIRWKLIAGVAGAATAAGAAVAFVAAVL